MIRHILLPLSLLLLSLTLAAQVPPADTLANQPANATETPKPKPTKQTVMICLSTKAYAYHSRRCRGLANCKAGTKTVTLNEAQQSGYKPCKICY